MIDVPDDVLATLDEDASASASGPPGEADIDPRFEARLAEVEQDRLRRRHLVTLIVLGVAAAVALVSLIARAAIFDVDHVEVSGTNQETVAAVLDAAAVREGTAIWSVDLGAVEDRVEELAWVAEARIGRSWPDTITITISEYAATAFVRRDDDTVALLGADGRVLADDSIAPPGIVEIVGVRKTPEVGAVLYPPGVGAVIVQIPASLARRVQAVDVSDGVTLRLAPTGEIRLCTADDLAAKGRVATDLFAARAGSPFEYIDVCVPTVPVVK